ncbi:MAG: hypothetical protein K6A89_08810 [Treponema sp.]|nr:hypothetical protein [Treponema sp.]
MKLKLLCITTLIFFLTTFKCFSLGAGMQIGVNPFSISSSEESVNSFEGNVTGTLRFSRLPFVVGAGFNAGMRNSDFIFGLSTFADWYIIDLQIKNIWNFYSGIGVIGNLNFNTDFNYFPEAGSKVFIGTSVIFIDNFIELNLQANAQPSVIFKSEEPEFRLSFPIESGIRFHF